MSRPEPPDGWPYHPWHRLVRRRRPLGAEVPASVPGRRAWVSVAPADLGPLGGGYQITCYEVDREECERARRLMEATGRQPELAQVTRLDEKVLVAFSQEELRELLAYWLEDVERFGDPALDGSLVHLRGSE
jgi:hypothetical protein